MGVRVAQPAAKQFVVLQQVEVLYGVVSQVALLHDAELLVVFDQLWQQFALAAHLFKHVAQVAAGHLALLELFCQLTNVVLVAAPRARLDQLRQLVLQAPVLLAAKRCEREHWLDQRRHL
uniref:Uncharacterized 13.4 kDa protein in ubiquitin 3'region n=1 Tax=Orgyia pseudotsugata multicapsid polyhedrosis virus TaxID=262177 RepID=Y13K_NPVOP|nr:RecName: Full=Uncharacterized 13.4 kDa protein in ubiquitin 3'region; AltName: Full=Lambda 208 [Orgyia pseudotsugata multiple nucleopolyhedrovirus]BAA02641.1 lambda 208 [Orgyia pseudotsugata single capsid nuclopolyhedrovirus]